MSVSRIVLGFMGVWALAGGVIALFLLGQWETNLPWLLVGAFLTFQAAMLATAPLVDKRNITARERRKRMATYIALVILTIALMNAPRWIISTIG